MSKTFIDSKFFSFLRERGENFTSVWEKLEKIPNLITDVRCLQEIVYSYHMLGETAKGYEYANMIRQKIEILAIDKAVIDEQENLLELYPAYNPRELLHCAVMRLNKISCVICSPESGYQEIDGLEVRNVLSTVSNQI